MGFRELGAVSLPRAAWRGGQSMQPLQRRLAWSVMVLLLEVGLSLELQVVIGGRVSDPKQPLPRHPVGLESRAEGALCSPCTLTHGAGESGAGCVPGRQHQASARAGGCTGSPPGNPRFPVGSRTSTHRQLQDVTAQRGRGNWRGGMVRGQRRRGQLPGGARHGAIAGMPAQRPSWRSLHPCGPGRRAGRGGETLALLLHLSVCCTHQILC